MDHNSDKLQKHYEFFEEKTYIIHYCETNEVLRVEPQAVESCMNPGVFNIKPVSYHEDNTNIHISNDNYSIDLLKEDILLGKVEIITEEFKPKIYRKQGMCTSCTNCGQCSY